MEWTADQRRLASLTKEYAGVFQTLAMRKHDPPDQEIIHDYRRFREWWDIYKDNPEAGTDPYKKFNHGFSLKK